MSLKDLYQKYYYVSNCLILLAIILSCKSIPKELLNSPLGDNNNSKFNPPGVLDKNIKYCLAIPYDIKNGALQKRKDSYKYYFDNKGRYYKEEKYHLGHMVEYSLYQFDNANNLREATKYALFPERTVTAKAKFAYHKDQVSYEYIEQGDMWRQMDTEFDKYGNAISKRTIRKKVDKRGKVRIDTFYYTAEYELDDSNRVLQKSVYRVKGDQKRFLHRTNFSYYKGDKVKTESKHDSKDELVYFIKYEYREEDGKIIKEVFLDKDMEMDKEMEYVYDKWDNVIQKNSILEGFESFGTKSKYNNLGNIVRQVMYDKATNKPIQMWKFEYFHEKK